MSWIQRPRMLPSRMWQISTKRSQPVGSPSGRTMYSASSRTAQRGEILRNDDMRRKVRPATWNAPHRYDSHARPSSSKSKRSATRARVWGWGQTVERRMDMMEDEGTLRGSHFRSPRSTTTVSSSRLARRVLLTSMSRPRSEGVAAA